MTRLYISGKIAGLDVIEARQNFSHAEFLLLNAGYSTHNPYDTAPLCRGMNMDKVGCTPDDPAFEHAWSCYLRYDIIDMLACDGVALLDNWNTPKGAVLELFVARQCGLELRTVTEWLTAA